MKYKARRRLPNLLTVSVRVRVDKTRCSGGTKCPRGIRVLERGNFHLAGQFIYIRGVNRGLSHSEANNPD